MTIKKSLFLIPVFLVLLFLVNQAGNFLVVADTPLKADAILILMGSRGDRALQAAELWKKGLARQIIFVDDYENGREFLAERGIQLPNDAFMTTSILNQLGIPASSILTLPGEAMSTLNEAEALQLHLRQHPETDTLLLVTSKSHSRRAMIIFQAQLNKLPHHVVLCSVPSNYDRFKPTGWWKHRESAKQVFMEYVKITSFLLFEQWQ